MKRALGFFVLILGTLAFVLGASQEPQRCPNESPIRQQDRSFLDRTSPYFFAGYCAIFASRNLQRTVALATSVYAIFAILQWRAIRQQARLAEAHIGYLTKLERPYVFIEDMKVITIRPNVPMKIAFTFRNNGRGPAIIFRRGFTIFYNFPLPLTPDYGRCPVQPGLAILGPHSASDPPIECTITTGDDVGFQEVATAMSSNRCFFWRFVDYRDLFGDTHTTRFGFQFISEANGFVPVDNERYNDYT